MDPVQLVPVYTPWLAGLLGLFLGTTIGFIVSALWHDWQGTK